MAKPAGQRRRTATRPSTAAAHDLDTEARILDAAHSVFLRRGTAGARMQEIADEAGVNKALLHYYFRNKDRLAAVIFGRVASAFVPPLTEIIAEDAALEHIVRRIVALYLDLLLQHPYFAPYVVGELHQHPERLLGAMQAGGGVDLAALRLRVFKVIDAKVKAAVRAGTIRPIAIEDFIVNLLGLCIFPFVARPMLGFALQMDDDAFRRFITRRKKELPEFYLRGLRP